MNNKPTGIEACAKELSKFIKDCDGCDAYSESYLINIIAKHCVGKEHAGYKLIESYREERTQLLAACKEYREKIDDLQQECNLAHQLAADEHGQA